MWGAAIAAAAALFLKEPRVLNGPPIVLTATEEARVEGYLGQLGPNTTLRIETAYPEPDSLFSCVQASTVRRATPSTLAFWGGGCTCDQLALPPNLAFLLRSGDTVGPLPNAAVVSHARTLHGYGVLLKCSLYVERHWGPRPRDPLEYDAKADAAVWRGSTTGHGADRRPNRFELVRRWSGTSPVLDVGFSRVLQRGKWNRTVETEPKVVGTMDRQAQLRFKFIIVAEGNDVASSLHWILNTRSVAVMPHPTKVSWLRQDLLVPGVHYLAVRADWADLEEVVRWGIAHPAECLTIASNAQGYMRRFDDPVREAALQTEVLRRYAERVELPPPPHPTRPFDWRRTRWLRWAAGPTLWTTLSGAAESVKCGGWQCPPTTDDTATLLADALAAVAPRAAPWLASAAVLVYGEALDELRPILSAARRYRGGGNDEWHRALTAAGCAYNGHFQTPPNGDYPGGGSLAERDFGQ